MALPDLTGQNIENTYNRVVQTDGTFFYDGTGSLLNLGGNIDTGSFATTGSNTFTGGQIISSSGVQVPLQVVSGSTSLLFVSSSGNVGIGTSTPLNPLHVSGSARINGTTVIAPAIVTGSAATSALNISQTWDTSGNPTAIILNITGVSFVGAPKLLDLQLSGASRFSVDAYGNTNAAGTATSAQNVSSYGYTTNAGVNFTQNFHQYVAAGSIQGSTGTSESTGFLFTRTINQTGAATGITRGLYINPTITAAADFRAIETRRGNILFQSGSTPLLFVSESGRVGFGTSAPTFAFQFSSSVSTDSLAVTSGNSTIRLTPNAGLGNPGIASSGIIHIASPINGTGGTEVLQVRKGAASNFIQYWATNGGTTLSAVDGNGNLGIGTGGSALSASLSVAGTTRMSGSFNTSASGSILTVVGSGSAQPIFTVLGSQGELFSITDSLSGSLFSVNDISGLPILEVFSDSTTLIGDYLDPMLITTKKVTMTNSGSFVVYSLPTASYDTAFFDYSIRSGSNARAGQIMAIQSASVVNYTETTTTDFGSTTAVSFGVFVTGSNMVLSGSAATGSWTIKAIIRGI